MKTTSTLVQWILLHNILLTCARSWKEIELVHDMKQPDYGGLAFLEAKEQQLLDELKSGKSPTPAPNSAPTAERLPTTIAPSPSPSAIPSNIPSFMPSNAPSFAPSSQPSNLPTELPSSVPSLDPYPQSPQDTSTKGFFNYDDTSAYGPSDWSSVELPENYYWNEFDNDGFGIWKGLLHDREPGDNRCARSKRQSPIDIRENGASCDETHEIRDKAGDIPLESDLVQKRIESNKLRLEYVRRPCTDVWDPKCQMPNPPFADFPNGWKGTGDVVHIDFKVPSEHMIWGERFDAEMQIYHIHPVNHRIVSLATMIRAEVDGFNYYFQEALDAFQIVYDENQANCASFMQTGIVVDSDFKQTATQRNKGGQKNGNRELQFNGVFNPYHEMLIPTLYFYRYDGSLTEPPCAEMVSWFVSDKPMIISFEQLDQMKSIQFTNVDKTCKTTSVHSGQSVARPIQDTSDRRVWKCTSDDFGPDPK